MFYSELKTSFVWKKFNEKNPLDFCPISREFLEHVTLNLVWIIQWVSPEIQNVLRAYLMLFLSYLGKGTGEGVAFPSCLYVKQCSMKNKYRIYFNNFTARSFFWSVFSCIWTKYGEMRMRENTDQKKLRIWTLFTQCLFYLISWGIMKP